MSQEIPQVLYKYRDWSNPYHKRCITEPEVYFASSKEFNDPFDCAMPFKYAEEDLTEEKMFNKRITLLKRSHPSLSDLEMHTLAFESQKENLVLDEQYVKQQNELRKEHFNKDFGILSLSTESNNILMWSHYAASNAGFCIGYDAKKLFSQTGGRLGPVFYDDKFPEFGLFDNGMEHMTKYSSIKSNVWSYEKEYRILIAYTKGKVYKLSPDTIKEIMFGCRLEMKEKLRLLELIKKMYPAISVYEMTPNGKKFELDLNRIY